MHRNEGFNGERENMKTNIACKGNEEGHNRGKEVSLAGGKWGPGVVDESLKVGLVIIVEQEKKR